MGTEIIHQASGQRPFGTDHGQADLFLQGPGAQSLDVGDRQVAHALGLGRTAIARRDEHHVDLGRLRQLPGKGVFTAAATHHEDFHRPALW